VTANAKARANASARANANVKVTANAKARANASAKATAVVKVKAGVVAKVKAGVVAKVKAEASQVKVTAGPLAIVVTRWDSSAKSWLRYPSGWAEWKGNWPSCAA